MRVRSVVSLALVALIAGAIAAHADSAGSPRRARTPVRVVAAPAPARPFAGVAPLAIACAAPVPVNPRRPTPQPPKAAGRAAVPAAARRLRDPAPPAHRPGRAVARGARGPARARPITGVARLVARLLRSTASGGKAWVVPVPNVVRPPRGRLRVRRPVGPARGAGRRRRRRCRERRGRGARRSRPRPRARHARAVRRRRPLHALDLGHRAQRGAGRLPHRPRRHRGARRRQDNAYEFLLPNQRAYEQRYVVWTGGDGTPHVQPIVTFAAVRTRACTAAAKLSAMVARVSPDGLVPCAGPPIVSKFATPLKDRPSRALRLRRQAAAMLFVARCTGLGPFAPGVAVPARPVPVPPVAIVPARPAPAPARPPSAVPSRPLPAPATPAPAPGRKHR